MTPLRQRFIEDLQLRNRSPKTIEAYVYHVRELARHFKQSPEQLGDDQVHRYLLHLLHGKQVSWSSYNQAVAALRFFYRVSFPSDTVVTRLPYGKRPKRLPAVRSPQQVALFLDTVHDRTVRIVLRTIYATGLRISEALHLTAPQIDSSRMVVRVLGKGQKERLVPLSPQLLEELRAYWRETRPTQRHCRGSLPTHFATAMPRISWKRESTPERSKPCWAIIASGPRLCTRTSHWRECGRWSARSTVCSRRRAYRPVTNLGSARAAVWSRVPGALAPVPPRAADASGPGALPHTRPGRARDPVRSLRRGSIPLSFLRQPKLSSVRWK